MSGIFRGKDTGSLGALGAEIDLSKDDPSLLMPQVGDDPLWYKALNRGIPILVLIAIYKAATK